MKSLLRSTLLARSFALLVLAALPFAISGCFVVAAGAAGAGTVAYIRGELDATLPTDLDATDAAANRALQRLQFMKISEAKDALSVSIAARTAQDKKIGITLSKTADNLTRVRIRVGLFGDETASRALLDAIKAS
ncbi:MAG TPA: DUF3568 family protein [Opitutaceae bacterium]|nr:DUF3568 family protein [Opitutaceae bacterium]